MWMQVPPRYRSVRRKQNSKSITTEINTKIKLRCSLGLGRINIEGKLFNIHIFEGWRDSSSILTRKRVNKETLVIYFNSVTKYIISCKQHRYYARDRQ